jgi:hypothetical protein
MASALASAAIGRRSELKAKVGNQIRDAIDLLGLAF